MEVSNLSDAEFKTLAIRMLKELGEDLNSINNIQSGMKNILIKIRNNLQVNNSRVDEAKNQINDLEYKETKNNQTEKQEGNRIQKNKDSIKTIWDNFKCSNIHIIGLPEGVEKEQEI